jgi:hypothetical protein
MLAKGKNYHANIESNFFMNFPPEKNMGYLHIILWKKMFCAKKVTKLPDLTVPHQTLTSYYDLKAEYKYSVLCVRHV